MLGYLPENDRKKQVRYPDTYPKVITWHNMIKTGVVPEYLLEYYYHKNQVWYPSESAHEFHVWHPGTYSSVKKRIWYPCIYPSMTIKAGLIPGYRLQPGVEPSYPTVEYIFSTRVLQDATARTDSASTKSLDLILHAISSTAFLIRREGTAFFEQQKRKRQTGRCRE